MSPGTGEQYPGDLLPHLPGSGTHFPLLQTPLPTPWSLGAVSAARLCWALVNTSILSLKSHPPTIWTWSHNASSSCNSVQLAKLFHFPCVRACLVAQSCPIVCNSFSCSPSGSSVHGMSQARILERVAISFSRGSSPPKNWTWVSRGSCVAGRFFPLSLNSD